MAGRIALFSHGYFLRALAVGWIGLPIQQGCHLGLDTGSISVLGYDRNTDAPVTSLWNAASNAVFDLAPHHADEVHW